MGTHYIFIRVNDRKQLFFYKFQPVTYTLKEIDDYSFLCV